MASVYTGYVAVNGAGWSSRIYSLQTSFASHPEIPARSISAVCRRNDYPDQFNTCCKYPGVKVNMNDAANLILIVVMLINIYLVGTGRLLSAIQIIAVQGVLLGLLPILVSGDLSPATLLMAAVFVLVKGIAIPNLLSRALREISVTREMQPLVSLTTTMLLLAVSTGAALLLYSGLPLLEIHRSSLIVPTALATIIAGIIMLVTRREAVTQVIGFLSLENGIFTFGLLLLHAVPWLFELGVLLDLLACIFVMGIILNNVRRTFASLDTYHMSSLRDR